MSSSPDRQRGPDELEIAKPLRPAAAVPAAAIRCIRRHRPSRRRAAASAVRPPRWPSRVDPPAVRASSVSVSCPVPPSRSPSGRSRRPSRRRHAPRHDDPARGGGHLPAAGHPGSRPGSAGDGVGPRPLRRRRGFREITISAISGSNVTLTTDDGWTRTVAITDDVELTKGGQDIAVSDLAVGDQVRFAQTRNDDGTYTVTAVAVVVPHVSGTVSELSDSGFKVTTRDGSVWTITTDGSTTYQYGAADGTRADLANGAVVLVQGESTGDNALRALGVRVAADRVVGTVTATTADTITVDQAGWHDGHGPCLGRDRVPRRSRGRRRRPRRRHGRHGDRRPGSDPGRRLHRRQRRDRRDRTRRSVMASSASVTAGAGRDATATTVRTTMTMGRPRRPRPRQPRPDLRVARVYRTRATSPPSQSRNARPAMRAISESTPRQQPGRSLGSTGPRGAPGSEPRALAASGLPTLGSTPTGPSNTAPSNDHRGWRPRQDSNLRPWA